MPRARRLLTASTAIAIAGVPIAATVVGTVGDAAAARLPVAKPALSTVATTTHVMTTPTRPSGTTVVDLGPTTFPVRLNRGQAAAGSFTVVLRSKLGPAVKVSHPRGIWAGNQVSVMWLSHVALKLSLHPGVATNYSSIADPGFSPFWTSSAVLSPVRPFQIGLAATFNGGFRIATGDSRGGYWDYGARYGAHGIGVGTGGRIVYDPFGHRSLSPGAQSLVIYKDGTWNIGTWRTEVNINPKVAYVRQELTPLIDRGVISAATRSWDCLGVWGLTLRGAGCYEWRSGVGITATGDLVYVSANGIDPYQLAQLLQQAGAIRAMQLDINPQWMAAEYYTPGAGGSATPHVVYTHYYSPYHYILGSIAAGTAVNRDFFAAYLR